MKRFSLILLIALCPVIALGQEKLKVDNSQAALTEVEQRELASVLSVGKAAERDLGQTVQSARNAKLEAADAIAILARIQLAFTRIDAAADKYIDMLDKHRRAHNCPDCVYTPDGKGLVKPQAGKEKLQ